MHFEILVEDQSRKEALDIFLAKILDPTLHTFKIHPYKGIGRIPENLKSPADARRRILLQELPRLLSGYGKTFASYPPEYRAAVIVVCDLDDKCPITFKAELRNILQKCDAPSATHFCFAIEEGEAWFLGDIDAIKAAYPRAKTAILQSYKNDAICGTWEKLADAIYPGGAKALTKRGWQAVGAEKSRWARAIAPHLSAEHNRSPSFRYFLQTIEALLNASAKPGQTDT